jgi:3D (Asp-Asp-Asp) domain-containing protein
MESLLDIAKFVTAKIRENQMNSSHRTTYVLLFELQTTPRRHASGCLLFESQSPNELMKTILYAFSFLLLCAPVSRAAEQSFLARVTVYWASGGGGSDYWTRRHVGASGARLRAGHCAVDPRRIPYGSKVTLPDGTLLAVDTGSAVRSRKAARLCGRTAFERNAIVIDRFFETKQQALSWARRNPYFMFVKVSPPNLRSGPSFTQPQKTTLTVMPPISSPQSRRIVEARPTRRPGWMP